MLVGGMVGHEIEKEFQSPLVRGREQLVELVDSAELRIDVGVVGNVIAKIGHRRAKDRRHPDRINSKLYEVAKPAKHAGQIADPVSVGILERPRIDLIYDSGLPPHGSYCCRANDGAQSLSPSLSREDCVW